MVNRTSRLIALLLVTLFFAACTHETNDSLNQDDLNSDGEGSTSRIEKFEGTCTVTDVYPNASTTVLVRMDLTADGETATLPGLTAMGCEEGIAVGDTFDCAILHNLQPSGGINPWGSHGETCTQLEGYFFGRFQMDCLYRTIEGSCHLNQTSSGEANRSFIFTWTENGVSNTITDNTLPDYAADFGPKMETGNSFPCSASLRKSGRETCASCVFEYPMDGHIAIREFSCSSAAEQLLRNQVE